jgi:hypothetical protein
MHEERRHHVALDNRALVLEYAEAAGKSELDRLSTFLHPDLEFSGPGVPTLHGIPEFIAVSRSLIPILLRWDIKRVFLDGDEACLIYDAVTDTAVESLPAAEWLTIEAGRIRRIRLIFDNRRWPEVMEEAAKRAGSVGAAP